MVSRSATSTSATATPSTARAAPIKTVRRWRRVMGVSLLQTLRSEPQGFGERVELLQRLGFCRKIAARFRQGRDGVIAAPEHHIRANEALPARQIAAVRLE